MTPAKIAAAIIHDRQPDVPPMWQDEPGPDDLIERDR